MFENYYLLSAFAADELSIERYAVCNDNPLAIDYRDFSPLVKFNPKEGAMGK